MFALFGAKNVAGVAAFGVFYGFFSGGGQLLPSDHFENWTADTLTRIT